MATKQERSDIALLQSDVAELKTNVALLKQSSEQVVKPTLETINHKLDVLLPTLATKNELEELRKENLDAIARVQLNHDKQIAELKRKHTVDAWLTGTLSAAFGALLTALLMYWFTDISRPGGSG